MTCRCSDLYQGGQPAVDVLGQIRKDCPALRDLLLPSDSWQMLVEAKNSPPDQARHASYLLLAFERGNLAKFTAPIHRFLLQNGQLHKNLTNQYRQDLQERWLSKETGEERHKRFRGFFGKVAELQLASWIADSGWSIKGLAALDGAADIIAESPGGHSYSLEIKYIGSSDCQFRELLAADGGGSIPGNEATNYLRFRVYEAACQLRKNLRDCSIIRVAAIVIEAQNGFRFDLPLLNGWIQWDAPAFLQAPKWNDFLEKQRSRYPNVDNELAPIVSSLNELWVFTLDEGHQFKQVFRGVRGGSDAGESPGSVKALPLCCRNDQLRRATS